MFLTERVQTYIDRREFPDNEQLLAMFCDGGSLFIEQEDYNWDFKDQWPYSYSDEYFLAISRLIAAFANRSGGFIIFGVHDQKRTGGHNKVKTNTDKLRQTIVSLMGRCPEFQIRHYELPAIGDVDCLLIRSRALGEEPYRFIKETKYGNAIYLRDGHSVVKAESRHMPQLFCRVSDETQAEDNQWLSGSLPPTPRTSGKFIGRMETMNYLFNWLFNSDEPQTYIYGKGGSGKTTVAHEFASLVKAYGAGIKIFGNDALDLVLFLTAKEISFAPNHANSTVSSVADFTDERSAYIKILNYSGLYSEVDQLESKSLDELRRLLTEFFDDFSSLIVLDDIDTLTTKNVEVGTNFLYRTLARAKRSSKILCTQRDKPAHAISNSREVPGLDEKEEYPAFVDQCSQQYGVPPPTKEERSKLAGISERRPLVVEYLIALRHSCPNYETAFRLFSGDTGNDIRDYVFRREWTNLVQGPDSRSFLAALALLNRPASFEDMLTILQFGEVRLRDAISATRAMFLTVNDAGQEVTYNLDTLTRSFVLRESERLDKISVIKARVKTFEKAYFPQVPQISRLAIRASDFIRKGKRPGDPLFLDSAWDLVHDRKLPASITEHPHFQSVYGYVASALQPPKLQEARAAFKFVFGTKFPPPIEHLRCWFFAERNSGIGFSRCLEICDFVISGRSYDRGQKVQFSAYKALLLNHQGRESAFDNPVEAVNSYLQALVLHCNVFKNNLAMNNDRASDSEKYIQDTAMNLFDLSLRALGLDRSLATVAEVMKIANGYLDPIEVPATTVYKGVYLHSFDAPTLNRSAKEIARIVSSEINPDCWMDRTAPDRIKLLFQELDRRIRDMKR